MKVKFFTRSDKPSAAGLTHEEVENIQKKMIKESFNDQNPFFEEVQGEELKHKESKMEGNSLKKVKDFVNPRKKKMNKKFKEKFKI